MVELGLGHPPPLLSLVEGIQGVLGGPHLDLGALVNVHVAVAVLPEGLGVGLWPANDQVWLFSILTAFFTNHVGVFEHNRGTFYPLFSVVQELWCPFNEVSFICHLGNDLRKEQGDIYLN